MSKIERIAITEKKERSRFTVAKTSDFWLREVNSRVSLTLENGQLTFDWDDMHGRIILRKGITHTEHHRHGTMYITALPAPDTMRVVIISRHLILPVPYDLG